MKKFALGVIFALAACGASHAATGSQLTFGNKGIFKSSFSLSNQVNLFIATGNIVLNTAQIIKAGEGSGVTFQECYSSNAGYGFPMFFGSSVPTPGPAQFGTTVLNTNDGIYLNIKSTWGWCVTSTGTGLPAFMRYMWGYWEFPK